MTAQLLPASFAHLAGEPNRAADAALVAVLPDLEPFTQAAALEILLQRGDPSSLADAVGRFNEHPDVLQRLILARAGEFSAGIRIAVSSSSFQARAGAIEVVVRGEATGLVYLLADVLRSPCPRTRKLAAEGLNSLAARVLRRAETGPEAAETSLLDKQLDDLAEALQTAVQRWDIHRQPQVLEAALWLDDRVEPAVRRKLRQRHTTFHAALRSLIARTTDPRHAGFLLRSLAVPELRPAAAEAISRTDNIALLRAVLSHGFLLADPAIERGCRQVRNGRWLLRVPDVLPALDGPKAGGALRFLAACGAPREAKVEAFRELIGCQRDDIRRETVRHLVRDHSEPATKLLAVVAARAGDNIAAMAAREVRRRRSTAGMDGAAEGRPADTVPSPSGFDHFERYWNAFDDLDRRGRARANNAMRRHAGNLGAWLRGKLNSTDALDRARALRIVSSLGSTKDMDTVVFRAASDPDPIVRSLAVGMLVKLPGPTAVRLLRNALNDPDHRVQADAVEAFDRIGAAERVPWTIPKLSSPDARVRANAARSLLRAGLCQARRTLTDMLENPSSAQRLSALWAVEQAGVNPLRDRLRKMSCNDPNERVRRRAKEVCDVLANRSATPVACAPASESSRAGAHGRQPYRPLEGAA